MYDNNIKSILERLQKKATRPYIVHTLHNNLQHTVKKCTITF